MLEILTVAELRAADQAAISAGVPLVELMERAGAAVAEVVCERFEPCATVVLCGPGDNGGDGYVAARQLVERGWPVVVAALAPAASDAGKAMAAQWAGEIIPFGPEALEGRALAIDALFGAGLKRPLDGVARDTIERAEVLDLSMVAVDLPSGLDGDTGEPLGWAPSATLTVTFHRKKPAHVIEPGRSRCGEVVVRDIALASPADARLHENAPELWQAAIPWPLRDTHKSRRGSLGVVSGPLSSTGAARLSARAGLRIGAGLVTVLSPPDALAVNAAALEAVMVKPFDDEHALARLVAHFDVAVIGPAAGVGEATRANLTALSKANLRLVVDADALTSFMDDTVTLFALLDDGDVLTPHPGEFERVFPGLLLRSPERIAAAREAARLSGAVTLLKGSDTVVAAPDGRAVVNTNAEPWLATAGSGDTLAGIIAGLMAQGMGTFEAACAGAWIHAEAGRRFGPGLIAEDISEALPAILADLYARRPKRNRTPS